MAVKVLIPTPLRQFTGKQPSIECNAATVGEALGNLMASFAELRKHLYTDDGRIRSFVNVYLNDEDIRFLDKENTRTKDGDTISIVPSIAGGSFKAGGSPHPSFAEEKSEGERLWQFRPRHYSNRK
jgi:molybdopterin converting factor small subunit